MGKIILEEFRKLSDKEKCKRYKDMRDKDKYMFRITDPSPFMNVKTIGYMEVSKEKRIEARKRIEKVQKKVNKRLEKIEK